MQKKQLFKNIKKLKDFTEDTNFDNKIDRMFVKEELLNKVATAIFFNYCEFYNLTNKECLILIQIISNCTFRGNGEKLFSSIEAKEKMLPIWKIMKKYYTNKLFYYSFDENTIIIKNTFFEEQFEMKICIGKPKGFELYKILKERKCEK